MREYGPESDELTPEAIERLKRTLHCLQKTDRPKIVEDLSHALTLGDFSENAEYQDSKARLSRIDGRIFSIEERIRNAIVIDAGASDTIRVGGTVTFRLAGKEKTYRIVGSQESDPSRGNISYLSPLGKALLGRTVGESYAYHAPNGSIDQIVILSIE